MKRIFQYFFLEFSSLEHENLKNLCFLSNEKMN